MRKICVIDTEFNAFDHDGQNDGYQEITEIGAVVMENGNIIDRFYYTCTLFPKHKLTRRCQKITGIQADDIAKGIPFNEAVDKLNRFVRRNKVSRTYAYGAEDAIQMRATAKLNRSPAEIFGMINSIRNIYTVFSERLDLKYNFSLSDVCRVCKVGHDRAHMALYDAEDTALAYRNMMQNDIDWVLLDEIKHHKYNVGLYEKNRSVHHAVIRPLDEIDDAFITKLEKVFINARKVVTEPVLTALHDDMMRVVGRPDLEKGSKEL